MTPCVWRILCLRNSSSVLYFRQPPNLPTAARRNRKCTECGTTTFDRNRMSAESAHLSTFGAETETEDEIRSTSSWHILFTDHAQGCDVIFGSGTDPISAFTLLFALEVSSDEMRYISLRFTRNNALRLSRCKTVQDEICHDSSSSINTHR